VNAIRLLLPIVLFGASAHAATLEWVGDFEEGAASIAGAKTSDFDKRLYDEGKAADMSVQGAGGMSLCAAPRAGKYSGRARILAGGKNLRVRTELLSNPRYNFMWDGPEYWVGYSFCLAQWPAGSDVHTFLQIHAPNEDVQKVCDFAGNALTIGDAGDTGKILVIDNPGGRSAGTGAFSNSKTVYTFPLRSTLGKWQNFVFKFKLSTKGAGYFTVWHNGKQVATGSGLTNVNWKDSCGNPIDKTYHNGLHVGMYGGPNSAGPKTVYMDAARIAIGADGYNLVAP
jgi:hypothetical protein